MTHVHLDLSALLGFVGMVSTRLTHSFGLQNSISAVSTLRAQQNVPQICPNDVCPLIGDSEVTGVDIEAITQFVVSAAQYLAYISIALAVLFLVISGLQMVTDTGDGKRAETAKNNFKTTIIGLLLVITAFTIVQVIAGVVSGDVLSGFTF